MKKFLIFCLAVVISISAFGFWMWHSDPEGIPILKYHRVNDVDQNEATLTVEQFEAQMKFLVDEGYSVISPAELLDAWEGKGSLPQKPVVITFDDGHVDAYKNVFPILQKYNLKATFFVVTDNINLYPDCLTWQQAKEMQDSGLVEIESRTLSNKDLTKIRSRDKLWDQIYGSKQAIEWYLKKPANFIAYPYGMYDLDTEDMSKEVGYRASFIDSYGLAHKEDEDSFVMERIPVFGANSHTLLRFQLRLQGAALFSPLEKLKNKISSDGNPEVADLILLP